MLVCVALNEFRACGKISIDYNINCDLCYIFKIFNISLHYPCITNISHVIRKKYSSLKKYMMDINIDDNRLHNGFINYQRDSKFSFKEIYKVYKREIRSIMARNSDYYHDERIEYLQLHIGGRNGKLKHIKYFSEE